jgi:hypothetical protein
MAKDLVNSLYRFLKEDVTEKQLFEADKGIKIPESKVIDLEEGKVPKDPSTNPEGYMGDLKEKEDEKKEKKEEKGVAGEIPPAPQTADNKNSKAEKELAKETPELKDNDVLKKQETQGAEQKEVEKEKVKKNEGKVPKDPSGDNPENKKDLKEAQPKEKELTTMSDENAAKQLASKYAGGRVVPDAQGKQFIVMVPESTEIKEEDAKPAPKVPCEACKKEACECSKANETKKEDDAAQAITKSSTSLLRKIHKADSADSLEKIMDEIEKSATKGKINAEQETRLKAAFARREKALQANPKAPETEPTQAEEKEIEECVVKKIKEDTEVAVNTGDKTVTVLSTDTATTVTTTTVAAAPIEPIPAEPIAAPVPTEEPVADELPPEDEEMNGEEIADMAERMLLTGHLKSKPKLSKKEKEFVVATESKKLSEKNKKLVDEKLALLKNKK